MQPGLSRYQQQGFLQLSCSPIQIKASEDINRQQDCNAHLLSSLLDALGDSLACARSSGEGAGGGTGGGDGTEHDGYVFAVVCDDEEGVIK